MPEGDTIHALAATLREQLEGRELVQARFEGEVLESLLGRRIDAVFAVGKHLFVGVGPTLLRSHLGMHGSWHAYAPDEPWLRPAWQATFVIATEQRVFACFRTREAEVMDRRGVRFRRLMAWLGPDVLAQDFDPGVAVARARERLAPAAPLVDVLLDQRVACGIGNVWKSELLFLAGLDPRAPLETVPDDRLAQLYERAARGLARNLGPARRRTRAPRPRRGLATLERDDDPGLWVYRRAGEPCSLCGAPIRTERLGKDRRSTYWCSACQPADAAATSGEPAR